MVTTGIKETIKSSIEKLEKWIEAHHYKGYEPFDGLSSPFRIFTFNMNLGDRLLQQLVRQSPINIRPILGIKPLESTKGRGYITWGHIKKYQTTRCVREKTKVYDGLDWLRLNKSKKYSQHCWGNSFNYASRAGRIDKDEPTIVWTSLIGQVYLEAFEIFKEDKILDILYSIREWMLSLPREKTSKGECLSYVKFGQSSIHNSNMLGAAFLAQLSKIIDDREATEVAQKAMEYSCAGQLKNGAWYYGEAQKYHWVDNFHTGYNLDSLFRYINAKGDGKFKENLRKGYSYFKKNFFEDSAVAKYYNDRIFPIDIQCAAQAIDTLVLFSDYDEEALQLAVQVADWTIQNMQDSDGHFYYRIYPIGLKAKAAMIHWGQGTMFKSLNHLYLKIAGL